MHDRKITELAAKAAGINLEDHQPVLARDGQSYLPPVLGRWNPLEDDGDSQRLAVLLGISVCQDEPIEVDVHEYQGVREGEYEMGAEAWIVNPKIFYKAHEIYGGNRFKATRRAIVRVAAAIQQAREAT